MTPTDKYAEEPRYGLPEIPYIKLNDKAFTLAWKMFLFATDEAKMDRDAVLQASIRTYLYASGLDGVKTQ